ncbi:MAG: hypothetical protein AAGJ87_17130, partial [Pseudomonadota bacterium]
YWLWTRRVHAEINEGAAEAWERAKKSEPDIIDGYNEERFAAVYRRVHFPRFPGYAVAAIFTFALSLPATLAALSGAVWAGVQTGVIPKPAQIVRYIPLGETSADGAGFCSADCKLYVAEAFSGFYFFFAIVIVWIAVFAFFMRRYHARKPGYLRDELIRNRS